MDDGKSHSAGVGERIEPQPSRPRVPQEKESEMLDLLRYLSNARFALACVFVLVIVGTLAIAVPAMSQTPTQEQEAAAIEEEDAQVDVGRRGRAGRAGMFERLAAYFRGGAGAHAGMRGGQPGFAAGAQGHRSGMPGGPMGARRGRAGIGGGRLDLASRALGRAEEISLTDVQTQGIEETRDAHRRLQIERDASKKLVGLDLAELLKDESSDLTAVEQKMRETADLEVQEQMAALRYRRNVQGILSAEQIEQLKDVGDRTARRRPSEDRTPRTRRQR
jgi:Spy/CpxP family protein refolding chaperone